MRNDYVQAAYKVIDDPYILVNVISRRVKQLRRGYRPLVESLEKLSAEDTALREVAEGKISYELAAPVLPTPILGPRTERALRMATTRDNSQKTSTPGAFRA
ncbi:MAG: DNA-directed RNA polymerase subunit omega [Opitutales bacterium]